MAGPLLRAAADSAEALDETLRVLETQLRIAMMCSGAGTLEALSRIPLDTVVGT